MEERIGKLVEIINSVIENANVTEMDQELDLRTVGMDSMAFVHIVVNIENEFEIEVDDDHLFMDKMYTMQSMNEMIEEMMEEANFGEE